MLYLIPTPIASTNSTSEEIRGALLECDYFVVENVRTARRFISSLKLGMVIDSLEFVELSEHTNESDIAEILAPIIKGRKAALMSEAGLPCVADPGSLLVAAAHRAGVRVVPFIGASSIMLALMSSGASGQSFAFNGYLPVKSELRVKAIRDFEQRASRGSQTQIFIETPYRNIQLFTDFLVALRPDTMLTIAADLTAPTEYIATHSIKEWGAQKAPDINKRPAIFILFLL